MNLMGLQSPERYESWNRYFGISNVCFIDGHVEAPTPAQVEQIGPRYPRYMLATYRKRYRVGPGLTPPPQGS